MAFIEEKWLFYLLLCVSFVFTAILVCIWIRWCLQKKTKSKRPEKLELKNTAAFNYEAGLHPQQMPLRMQYPPKSLPASPLHHRQFSEGAIPFGTQRRHSLGPHSLDPGTLDVEMYSREKSESMGSLPYFGLGRLCFQLLYDKQSEKLHVKLNGIAQLHQKNANIVPHVFVKVVLMPDKKRRFQSKTVKGTNPELNDEFAFAVPLDEILNRTIRMTVCTYDRFSRQNTVGYIVFPIIEAKEDLAMEEGTAEIWREITKEDIIPGEVNGSILVSLMHLPTAGRLTVVVLKCKDLRVHDDMDSGVYVKVSMVSGGKTVKTKKTSAFRKRDIANPVFNESFLFDIPNEYMDKISFIMAVCANPRSGSSKRIVGRIVIGPYMYSSGDGLAHWNDMLLSSRHSVAHWHELTR